jgi:hypothetical protein
MPAESEFYEEYDGNDGYLALIQHAINDSGVINNPIVVKTDITMEPVQDSQGVQITRIAWPLYANGHKMFYVTTVKKGTHAARTRKDVFWFIHQGNLSVTAANANHNLKEGDWFRIKEDTSYSVTTVNKCTVLEANIPESLVAYNQYKDRIKHAIDDTGVINNPIVRMTDIPIEPDTEAQGVQRTPIAWPLYKNGHKMFYIKKVPAGIYIKPHSHGEDVFRYITDPPPIPPTPPIPSELTVKSGYYTHHLKKGNWFRIKTDTSYSVTTVNGYTVLAAYIRRCAVARD